MSGINPYGSYILQGLFGGNNNAQSVQSAQILDAPTSLKNLATNLILKGEVTAQNAGREAVIRTDRGELTVRLKNDLPIGSKVDIQIPSGQNAKEVIIQPTLAKAIQKNQQAQQQGHVQTNTPQTTQSPQQPQTASTQTIADVKNLQVTATQATQNITNTLSNIVIGQSVRITPLSPAQQNIVLQNLTPSTPLPVTNSMTLKPQVTQGASQIILPTSLPTNNAGKIVIPTPPAVQNGTPQSTINLTPSVNSGTPRPVILTHTPTVQTIIQNTRTNIDIQPVRVRTLPSFQVPKGDVIGQNLLPHSGSSVPQAQVTSIRTPQPMPVDARLTSMTTPAVQMNTTATMQNSSPMSSKTINAPMVNGQMMAGQMSATVTGFVDADGNPIIQTFAPNNQIQLSTLHYPAKNLPQGTQIILHPVGSTVPSMNMGTPSPSWQNMTQFVDEMTSVFPAITAQSLLSLLPNPAQPKSFPAAALLFLAAAKGGDLSGWLGTKITRPAENHQAITKKTIEALMRDITSQSGRTATPSDPPMVQTNADWRGHILPLLLGADVHQATLWTKDQGEGQSKDEMDVKEKSGTRFIVDLTLSRMGDVYFDGLINQHKQHFDLSVITQRHLSTPMQNSIKSIWHKTLGGLGLDGVLTFKDNK